MPGVNWIRLLLCGVIAGVIWFMLSAFTLAFFAQDLLQFLQDSGAHPRWGGGWFLLVDIAMGVWAVWLYDAITPRYRSRPGTAVIAGISWWVIKSLQSAKFAGIGLVPQEILLIPLFTSLVCILAASLAGGFLYDRLGLTRRPAASKSDPRQ